MIKKGIILYLTVLLLILVIGGIDSLIESPLTLMLLIGLIISDTSNIAFQMMKHAYYH